MDVAVEEAVEDHALEPGAHSREELRLAVHVGRAQLLDVVDAVAVEALHHEDAPGRQARNDARGDDLGLPVLDHDAVELGHVLRPRGGNRAPRGCWPRSPRRCPPGSRARRAPTWPSPSRRAWSTRRSASTTRVDLRALHLDDDVLPVAQRGRVHLGDGRGRQGLRVDPREHLVRIAPELVAHGALHVREVEGAHAIEAAAKLGAVGLGEEALARGDELPELDVRGAEVLEGLAQGDGRVGLAAAHARPEERSHHLRARPPRAHEAPERARREHRRDAERPDGDPHRQRSARDPGRGEGDGHGRHHRRAGRAPLAGDEAKDVPVPEPDLRAITPLERAAADAAHRRATDRRVHEAHLSRGARTVPTAHARDT